MDKFYTKPEVVDACLKTLSLGGYFCVEPSAGNGEFFNKLPNPKLGLDIEPESPDIRSQDFFAFEGVATQKKIAVVGNPPFGRNSSLAIDFFNHAAKFADMIAFVVPKTFKKTSVQNRLNLGWDLWLTIDLDPNSFYIAETGKDFSANCCWQVWFPAKTVRQKVKLPTLHKDFLFTSRDKANIAIRRVGALAGRVYAEGFDNYSPNSNYFILCDDRITSRLQSLQEQFRDVASWTVANPSLSKSELVQIYTDNYSEY